jgi:hypothetical protein
MDNITSLQDVLRITNIESPYRDMLLLGCVWCTPGSIAIAYATLSSCLIAGSAVAL